MSHSHCPLGCNHPQPVTADENLQLRAGAILGHEYCSRCWVRYGLLSEMVPCTPITKEQADEALAAFRAMLEFSLGAGPHTAVEDENGAVHLLDKNDLIRASMPKDVYKEILEHNAKKAPVT